MSKLKKEGEYITYKGDCDVVRNGVNWLWSEFNEKELIIGKKYEVISLWCAQTVLKKDEAGLLVKDNSGERYLYYKIKNEQNQEIYVWEGFFEENTNL